VLPILSSDVKTGKLRPITITNTGKYAKRYIISHKPALAVQAWDHATGELLAKPIYEQHAVNVDISTKDLVISPGNSEKINIFFSAPSNLNIDERWLLSGYIYVTPKPTSEDTQNGVFKAQPAMSVPYAGMHGDYSKVPILTRPETGLPTVFGPGTVAGPDTVFSLKDADKPVVVVRILHPTKHIYVQVLDADSKDLGMATGSETAYSGRNDNTETNLSTQIPWDGTYLTRGTEKNDDDNGDTTKPKEPAVAVKSGKYKLKVMALRPNGKKGNPAHYQSWVSIDLNIDRNATATTNATGGLDAAINSYVRHKASIAPLKNTDSLVLPQKFRMVVAKE